MCVFPTSNKATANDAKVDKKTRNISKPHHKDKKNRPPPVKVKDFLAHRQSAKENVGKGNKVIVNSTSKSQRAGGDGSSKPASSMVYIIVRSDIVLSNTL